MNSFPKLNTARVDNLDAAYVRDWFAEVLSVASAWPQVMNRAFMEARLHPDAWWRGWFLSFPVMEREHIERLCSAKIVEAATLPLSRSAADAGARSAPARP